MGQSGAKRRTALPQCIPDRSRCSLRTQYDLFTNSQAETGALFEFVQFFESVENPFLPFPRDAASGIGNREQNPPLLFLYFECERDRALFGEFAGVCQQVDQHLRQALRVGLQDKGFDGRIKNALHAFFTAVGGRRNDLLTDGDDILRMQRETDFPRLEPRNIENIPDQRQQQV